MPSKYKIPLSITIRVWYQNHLERYFHYYRQVFKYAFTETAQAYGKGGWKSKVGFIVFNLIVIAIILVLRGKEEMMQEMGVFISILVAFGIVALLTFVWNIVIAPARLHFILKHKVRTTTLQQYEATQEIIRQGHLGIYLSMGAGFPFKEEHKTDNERKITYRVGVQDITLDSIQSVGLILERMTSLDRLGYRTEMIMSPLNLRAMGSSEKTIRIDPSTQPRQFFDVIEWYPKKSQIRICYHQSGYELFKNIQDTFDIHSRHVELKLVAQGQNVAETAAIFHLLLENKNWILYSAEEYQQLREAI
jgi:hypothetical protein